MGGLLFADQFFAEEPSSAASAPSAAKRIRFGCITPEEAQYSTGSKVQEEATSSLSVKAQYSAGSEASPFTSLSQKVYPLFARTRSDESTASNVSGKSYFSMAAPSSFTGGIGGAKAPAEK